MIELIREEDFVELPESNNHKWIQLEKIARGRLLDCKGSPAIDVSDERLVDQYMTVVKELADTFDVAGVNIPSDGTSDQKLEIFQLAVSRAQPRIWASGLPDYPLGRVAIGKEAKKTILDLAHEIEAKIDALDAGDKRKKALYRRLEDFRQEVSQPKTRIGTALTTLAQLSTIIAMGTTSLAQAPDAFRTIQLILGAEQLEAGGDEMQLIDEEKKLLLASPPKQITGPS